MRNRAVVLALVGLIYAVPVASPALALYDMSAHEKASSDASTSDAAPTPALPAGPSADDSIASATLPRDLSPWGMFSNASLTVKIVMGLLVAASIATWTIALAKSLELAAAKRQLRRQLKAIDNARSLADAFAALDLSKRAKIGVVVVAMRAAETELALSGGLSDATGIKERVASRLDRIEAAVQRRMSRGMGVLATVGAIGPFVGLFGTVWGIMTSFIAISKEHTTNLAVVAPGIAEALLATALGLVAAIPAVVLYNAFSRSVAGYRATFGDASAAIFRLVSRDLDRASDLDRLHDLDRADGLGPEIDRRTDELEARIARFGTKRTEGGHERTSR